MFTGSRTCVVRYYAVQCTLHFLYPTLYSTVQCTIDVYRLLIVCSVIPDYCKTSPPAYSNALTAPTSVAVYTISNYTCNNGYNSTLPSGSPYVQCVPDSASAGQWSPTSLSTASTQTYQCLGARLRFMSHTHSPITHTRPLARLPQTIPRPPRVH